MNSQGGVELIGSRLGGPGELVLSKGVVAVVAVVAAEVTFTCRPVD